MQVVVVAVMLPMAQRVVCTAAAVVVALILAALVLAALVDLVRFELFGLAIHDLSHQLALRTFEQG